MTDGVASDPDGAPLGDPGSCRSTAAALSTELSRLQRAAVGTAAESEVARLGRLGASLSVALSSYAADLARAQHRYVVATRDVERNAALALAARARRRLRIVCDDVARAASHSPARPAQPAVGRALSAPDTVSP